MRCYAFGLCTNLSCGLALVTYRQIKRWHTVSPDLVGPQACVEPVDIWWAARASRSVGSRQVLEPVGIWQADRCRHPFSSPSVRSHAWHRCRFPARPRSQLPDFFSTAFFSCGYFFPLCFFPRSQSRHRSRFISFSRERK